MAARREKEIDALASALIDAINANLSALNEDLSMAEGLYIAASALAETSATVMFDKLPPEALDKAEGIFEMFVAITHRVMEQILDAKRGGTPPPAPKKEASVNIKKTDSWEN